jgi:hypothetical protein
MSENESVSLTTSVFAICEAVAVEDICPAMQKNPLDVPETVIMSVPDLFNAVDLYKLKPITGLLVTIPFLSGDVSLAAMTLMSTTLESSCPKN